MTKVLIIELRSSHSISGGVALSAVQESLRDYRAAFDVITISEPFSLLCATGIGLESFEYDGLIIIGHMLYCKESKALFKVILRSLGDITAHYALPIGLGIFVANNQEEAELMAPEKARKASSSCIELLKIKTQFSFIGTNEYDSTGYSN